MNIILITNMTPASENIRGTSALPYHLLIYRPKNVRVAVYSLNYNNLSETEIKKSEKELDLNINILKRTKWIDWISKSKILLVLSILLKYPFLSYVELSNKDVRTIKELNPDGIWVYGEDMSNVSKQFQGFTRVHTLPDCESLYYYRILSKRFVFENWKTYWKSVIMYPKYLRMEQSFDTASEIQYTLVGEEDVIFLSNITPIIQVKFIRHPHYNIAQPNKKIEFSQPQIKLLLAGQYNHYMKQDADELIDLLCNKECIAHSNLIDDYQLTFLGRGWEKHVAKLKDAGWDVRHISFAPDYIDEIRKHDIQIAPICIGTGTKGKVLDAFSNGLLVIGSWYALENIAVKNGKSCIMYHHVKDILEVLEHIRNHVSEYEQMAEEGRQAILREHDRNKMSTELFGLFQ